MSCNGCRVLRKGCSDACPLRPCLQWIEGPEAQGHATVFVAKFFGRAGLMGFISSVPDAQRPALFRSLLYEACGRTVNPVYGAVGLLWSGNWNVCQAAVDTVLRGGSLKPSNGDAPCYGPMPNLPRLKQHSTAEKSAVKPPLATITPPLLDENTAAAGTLVRLATDSSSVKQPPLPQLLRPKRERDGEVEIAAPVPRRPRLRVDAAPGSVAATREDVIDLDLTLSSHPATPSLPSNKSSVAPPPAITRSRSPLSCYSNSSEGSVTSLDTNDWRTARVGDDGSSMDLLHRMELKHHHHHRRT